MQVNRVQVKLPLTPSSWVQISGEGAVARKAGEEFVTDASPSASGTPLVSLAITEEPPPSPAGPSLGAVSRLDDGLCWDMKRMDYRLALRFGHPLKASFHVGRRGPHFGIPSPAFPLLEPTAMTWVEAQAYHAVLLVEFLAMLTGKVGLLHASAVEREGRVLVLTSAGGVGKTTLACRLVGSSGFRHVADDILLVDPDGGVRRSFRRLMVYPYNTRDLPELESAVQSESGWRSRALWEVDKYLGLGRRRRRVPAHALFRGRVADEGCVAAVALLRRGVHAGSAMAPIDAEDLARRANEFVAIEYARFFEMLGLSLALLGSAAPASPSSVLAANQALVGGVFSRCGKLVVKDVAAGEDVTEEISGLLES